MLNYFLQIHKVIKQASRSFFAEMNIVHTWYSLLSKTISNETNLGEMLDCLKRVSLFSQLDTPVLQPRTGCLHQYTFANTAATQSIYQPIIRACLHAYQSFYESVRLHCRGIKQAQPR